ncbi:MAG TPA: sigma-70 family RNA polymerase sigma factor [Candidatus Limnocylindrales bacterium]
MFDRAQDGAAYEYAIATRAGVHDAYRLAGYLLGDAAEAQDAVQDALVRAWKGWGSLRDPDRFKPWFDRIVVNICRDRMRRNRNLKLVDLEAAANVECGDTFADMLASDELAGAVAALAPDHRIVIALRFWQDMTVEQVAETLNVPPGTVKSRLHYALKALRSEMREDAR